MSTVARYPDLPKVRAARPLEAVLRDIAANVEAQRVALSHGGSLRALQEDQQALYREKRRAEFARRGITPQIIGGAE